MESSTTGLIFAPGNVTFAGISLVDNMKEPFYALSSSFDVFVCALIFLDKSFLKG